MTKQTYWNEEAGVYEEVPKFLYPSEIELLKIFPEGKHMIRQKIAEWTEVKERLLATEVLPRLKEINVIQDGFDRDFALEFYKHTINPKYVEALEQLARLERLKVLTANSKHSRNIVNLEQKKEAAKQMPILDLYPFQQIKKLGSRFTALCPLHIEKSPSFVIYPNNTFFCFGCQAHGDSIDFLKLIKGCSFRDAVIQMGGT